MQKCEKLYLIDSGIILTLLEDPRILPCQIPLSLRVSQIQTAITQILEKPYFFIRRVMEEVLLMEDLLGEVLQALGVTAVPQALELFILF
jgi:hypothetical protein